MGIELINRIAIKKDGVYISTHSSNDSSPYRSVKIDFLTDAYNERGQEGLDEEIIKLLYSSAELRGNHQSLKRYYYAMDSAKKEDIINRYLDIVNDEFHKLNRTLGNALEKEKQFQSSRKRIKKEMYSDIAKYCREYDEKELNNEEQQDEPDITNEF